MKKESWFYRLLKRIGLIETHEISKKEMCENAKSVCNKNCESCAWEDDSYLVAGVEDGWIKVDNKTWRKYLKAKERLSK